MLYESSLPGRTRFISHAVREIRNRLPDAFGGGTRSQRLDYTKRLDAIERRMANNRSSRALDPD